MENYNMNFLSNWKVAMLFLFFAPLALMAQDPDPTIISTSEEELEEDDYKDTWKTPNITDEMTIDDEQNKSWRMGDYKFSSKPKNSWEVGLHAGHFFIDGDVDREIPGGWGVGLHLRKAINYSFSIRGSLFYGMAKGIENQFWRHKFNTSGGGINQIGGGLVEPTFDPYDPTTGGPGEWIPSFRTQYVSADMAVVLNIGNLLFHQERNKWNWYAAIGVGLDHHTANLDLLNASGDPYGTGIDGGIRQAIGWTQERFNTKAGRDEIEASIEAIYDGVYETEGFKKAGIFRFGDDFNVHVVFIPSMGISRKITKRINIGIEHQIFLSDNDYLDGIKFRTAVDQTNNADIGHYTHMRLGLNIGNFDKVTEPLYWLNPMDIAFTELNDLKNQPQLDLTDEDQDGVIDMLDQELNTPEGCPVDTRGVLLDSDGDGIVDCEDKEPYSRPGCPIDEYGVANCEEECCASEDDINKLIDARAEEFKAAALSNSSNYGGGGTVSRTVTNPDGTTTIIREPARTVTNADGTTTIVREPSRNNSGTYVSSGCGDWFLPMIHYDLNKYSIKPEYFSHLHNVAQVMKKCPTVCVTAQGFTDSRNSNDYNRVLSYRRAKSAVDYLVDNYAIDRSRIKLMYGGEENPMVNSPTSEAHHFMNRRVEFRTCDAVDFDMAPPEGTSTLSSGSSSQPDYYKGNKSSGY
jgi:outer membrane protein OmpA-like peptidoglycan-associated protein